MDRHRQSYWQKNWARSKIKKLERDREDRTKRIEEKNAMTAEMDYLMTVCPRLRVHRLVGEWL